MKDPSRTNQELIEENFSLKQRIQELEQSEAQHKQAEEKSQNVLNFLQTLINTIPSPIFCKDINGIYQDCNKEFEDYTGLKKEAIVGKGVYEMYPRDVADKYYEMDLALFRQPGRQIYEHPIIYADGNKHDVVVNKATYLNADGTLAGLVGVMVDISERKRAEEELLLMNMFLDSIVENIPDMIFLKDAAELRFVRFNRAGENLLGYSRNDLLGKNDYDFFPKEQADFFTAKDREVLHGKEVLYIPEEPIHTRKKGERILNTKKVPILDAMGEPAYLLGISEDITDKKMSEEKLKAAEELYRNIFMNSQTGLFRTDINTGIMLEANDSMARFAGYNNREELLSGNFNIAERYVDPEARNKMIAIIKEHGRCDNYETLFRRNDGSVIWIRLSAKLVPAKWWLEGVAEDITDIKQAENALRESEEKYRLIAENMADIISVLDMNLRTTYVSPSIMRVRGFTVEEAMEQTLDRIMTPASLQTALAAFEDEMKLEVSGTADPHRIRIMELEEYKKDGSLVLLEVSLSFLRDNNGKPVAILSVSRDITERRQAEVALRETQRKMTDIIEFLPDATLVIDRDGKVIAWNRAIESMTGVRSEAMLGKGNYEYAIPFYGERRPILIDLALQLDEGKEETYTTIQRMGDIIFGEAYTPALAPGNVHLSATASVLRDSRGEIIGAIECIRNNTDRKNMEEQLQRAERMESLGVLAGGVAHDLNNVLGVLIGYSELLTREVAVGSRAEKYAKSILQGGERAAAIIQDLLTMARRGVSVSETVNLNRIVTDFLKAPEFEFVKLQHPNVLFQSRLEKNLFNINGSPVHLFKTIMNLLSNAAESIRGVGEVSITTENRYVDVDIKGYENTREGEYVVLTVSDTGSGISSADMGRIFEPFYTKKVMGRRSGTGLGLAVVWGTVKDLGGYVDVSSKEGKGSTFTLYFPAVRDYLSEAYHDLSPDTYGGRGEDILVVDDVEEQRLLAATILEHLNYRVATVASGEDAVEYLSANKADLIVLDMIMEPGIDGLETYRRILEIHPHQKVIIVSGFAKTDRVEAAQKLGAGEYVKKPYVIEKLGITVRKELNRK